MHKLISPCKEGREGPQDWPAPACLSHPVIFPLPLLIKFLAPWPPHSCPGAFVAEMLFPRCLQGRFLLSSRCSSTVTSSSLFLTAVSDVLVSSFLSLSPLPWFIALFYFSFWYFSVPKGLYFFPCCLWLPPLPLNRSPLFTSEFQQFEHSRSLIIID